MVTLSLGITYSQFGKIWQQLNEPLKAENSFQNAISTFQTLLENAPSNLNYKSHLGKTHTSFAAFQAAQKKPNALLSFEKTISFNRDLFNQYPKNNDVIDSYILALSEFGIFLSTLNKFEKAIENFTEAITLFDSKSAQSQTPEPKAVIFEQMGNCYLGLKQKAKAKEMYENSFEIWQNLQQTKTLSDKEINKQKEIRQKISLLLN